MARAQLPQGPLVSLNTGKPTLPAHSFFAALDKMAAAVGDIENLDGGTSYTADELRDKIIELINALQG